MEIPVVFVQMDSNLGFSFINSMENVVPFTEVLDEGVKYNNYQRWQLPLTPSFATTTHKMQGSTVIGNCVTVPWKFQKGGPFCRGLDYVAHSRARELSSLLFWVLLLLNILLHTAMISNLFIKNIKDYEKFFFLNLTNA